MAQSNARHADPSNAESGLPACTVRIGSDPRVYELVRSFLVVLEEGSLNRAALRLHLAQSSLTRQMQALEHEIGGALLERTAIGMAPTAAGHALARRMLPVLAQFEEAVSEARRFARGQNSQIRVGYMRALAPMVLNPALGVLRKTYPTVKVELFDMTQGEQITAVRHGNHRRRSCWTGGRGPYPRILLAANRAAVASCRYARESPTGGGETDQNERAEG